MNILKHYQVTVVVFCSIITAAWSGRRIFQSFIMTLPVSMEDTELFPKVSHLDLNFGNLPLDLTAITQMRSSLSRLWWSRLVISVRGYVVNYVQSDEIALFNCDDAFIAVHRTLAEEKTDEERGKQFLLDLHAVVSFPLISELLLALSRGRDVPNNPFNERKQEFERIFGKANQITYSVANGQKSAYLVFMRVLCILQERWKAERAKKKGIRFETDPEWQPDDRVVLFQEFYKGNRTWVLLDFDRYILAQWRPRGANIIFGDEFVEKKKRNGMKLCAHCGMLEQQKGQFPDRRGLSFCSQQCLDEVLQEQNPGHSVTTINL